MPLCKMCKEIVKDHPSACIVHMSQQHPEENKSFHAALTSFATVFTMRNFELPESAQTIQDQAVEQLQQLMTAITTERKAEAEVRATRIYQAHTELKEDPRPSPGTPRKAPGKASS